MEQHTPGSSGQQGIQYISVLTLRKTEFNSNVHNFGACRYVNEFEKLDRIGEGTYGVVYKARDTKTREIVALKKVRVDEKTSRAHGISETALREISLLKRLNHPNIVSLKEIAVSRSIHGIFLVMEYCDQDLSGLIDNLEVPFSTGQIKCIMLQLLKALSYLHSNFVLHRDLKVSNLLLTSEGNLKVADFGLARVYGDPSLQMTPRVVTLWYRSPEILLGSRKQTPAIDMWATGCILGELICFRPLLPGKSEIDQIDRIVCLLGTPTKELWPEMINLPELQNFTLRPQPFNQLNVTFQDASSACLDLLNGLFTYDPAKRITAELALSHEYFEEAPYPCHQSMLPTSLPLDRKSRKRVHSRTIQIE